MLAPNTSHQILRPNEIATITSERPGVTHAWAQNSTGKSFPFEPREIFLVIAKEQYNPVEHGPEIYRIKQYEEPIRDEKNRPLYAVRALLPTPIENTEQSPAADSLS